MTTRTCPDWPELMELAPDLHFMHYSVAEAKLPAEALMNVPQLELGNVELCADLERHVFYAEHTDPAVAQALRETHWYELREWVTSGPGAAV